jgi:hypothetical protein
MIDLGLYAMYAFLAVAIIAWIGFSVANAVKTPGLFVKSLYGIGGLIVLFVIAYAMAGSSVTTEQAAKGITGGVSKLIGAGLITFYIVSGVAVLGLIYSEINKAIK